MAGKICAFCQREANRSGEHLWSAWIGKLFPNADAYQFRRTTAAGEESEWKLLRLDLKAHVVCKHCNETWMSDIEGTVKPLLPPMIRDGTPTLLRSEQSKPLAQFAFKSAIVASHIDRDKQPFFSERIRTSFRLSREIPRGVQMWIASFSKDGFHHGIFSSYYVRPAFGPLVGSEFNAFTHAAGHLVIQVLTPRWFQRQRRHESLPILAPNSAWRLAVARFWPNQGARIVWPPKLDLSDESLKRFKDRWKEPIVSEIP
jgi:hypothetical protein